MPQMATGGPRRRERPGSSSGGAHGRQGDLQDQPQGVAVADAVAPTPVSIRLVHAAAPGRARLHIDALVESNQVQRFLERTLPAIGGVSGAAASPLTGNLLVHYDPATPLEAIIGRIIELLQSGIGPSDDDSRDKKGWHHLDTEAVATDLATSRTRGLSEDEARERLVAAGSNALPALPTRSNLGIFLAQFDSVPVALLAGAAVVSLVTGALLEVGAILAVMGVNAAIGYRTETGTERIIQSLNLPAPQAARVIRDGDPHEVAAETLVPGDVLMLERGMVVPADARLSAVRGLTVSEAGLTGESMPVRKSDAPVAVTLPLAERTSMVYRGTVVTGGSGTAIVVATGARTEIGRVQQLVGATLAPQTPMQRQMGELGRQLGWLTLYAGGLIVGIGWLRGIALYQAARSALSLVVAAVPEGLPVLAVTTLALGVEDLRRRNILVRRLEAVEPMAAVQVACFDKTGTLTFGRMSVEVAVCGDQIYQAGEGSRLDGHDDAVAHPNGNDCLRRLLTIGCLCSEAEVEADEGDSILNGSATEKALVQAAIDSEIDVAALRRGFPKVSLQQRTETYRFMASAHANNGRLLLAVKGSPLEVLDRCRWEGLAGGGRRPLTPERRDRIEGINAELADRALRVLGFAYRDVGDETQDEPAVAELTWVGLAGLADPVRPGLKSLMAELHRAGLQTIILTGDQRATARAVAHKVGLNGTGDIDIVDAVDVDRMTEAELAVAARRAQAFSRVGPAQKLKIIRALQQSGATVAMIGDGINDSPALRAADVGIALGRDPYAAARETADVYLATDDLGGLIPAIERGRTTFTNIRKAIHYLFSTNFSEVLVMLCGMAVGLGEVLSPMQLLWINLISDVLPGLGLAMEPPEAAGMQDGPMVADKALPGVQNLASLTSEAALLGSGAMAAGLYGAMRYGTASPIVRTMTFGALVTAQLLHAITCRSSTRSVFDRGSSPANPALTGILAGSVAAQSAALFVPGIRRLLGLAPLGILDAGIMLAGGTLPFAIAEVRKSALSASTSHASAPLTFTRAPMAPANESRPRLLEAPANVSWLRPHGAK
ncbi:Ca2+-transporting ATPase [Sinorhizobium terangae]|uniref:HAD-IC family P-type ATPase n=1 Tax=Sinorhizobium terangae TaxID=110322 RepID=A0A6N7LMY2_SINTE|nr:HAD-IC family P-type ATPase [Sinorhizobium terangae]MBB4189342.1 Ca2+-transporting ATPase [Sinorhizobium terangae]MQX18977.1 HAD-IC family P-type ATPase [Sinorhizobium terangae]MQX19016.1 HAD-IC family P-type ATPase [Sinorhizobium terangae]